MNILPIDKYCILFELITQQVVKTLSFFNGKIDLEVVILNKLFLVVPKIKGIFLFDIVSVRKIILPNVCL